MHKIELSTIVSAKSESKTGKGRVLSIKITGSIPAEKEIIILREKK